MNGAIIAQITLSGAAMGLIYALVAYGFQLTQASSKSINFGQGELVMVSAFFCLTLLNWGLPFWLMVPVGMLFGAGLGMFVERAAVRPALEQKNEGWILLTIILGLFFFSLAENIWGRDDRPFPTPIPSDPIELFPGVNITPLEISVAVGVFAVMALVEAFKRYTLLGKAVEAVSADPEAAELMGISSTAAVVVSYALSGAVAAFAGILVSPITSVGPMMALALVLKAFSVAIVAGLGTGVGVALIGIVIGVLEGLASFYIGSGWREVPGLLLLILALALMPNGVFGKATIRKV
jgi:branched-chain amino acid transport system permease protein